MIVTGLNGILETFESGKTVEKVYVQKGLFSPRLNKVISEAKSHGVIVNFVDARELARLAESDKHQGVVALTGDFDYCEIEDILVRKEGKPLLLVLCDGIEDPHNLGAIIRSAECFGADGIIIPKRRSVTVNETVLKASSGAAAHIKIAKTDNLN
ncbi:MAG: RNA methyltransferase, partial [Christensenellaceae bacterium]|nr:RNA methyltransferase [Christensenellaceae bacterium]